MTTIDVRLIDNSTHALSGSSITQAPRVNNVSWKTLIRWIAAFMASTRIPVQKSAVAAGRVDHLRSRGSYSHFMLKCTLFYPLVQSNASKLLVQVLLPGYDLR